MAAKITITDVCGAACVTCLQNLVRPQRTMSVDMLVQVLDAVASRVDHVFINSTGDYLHLPNASEYTSVLHRFVELNPQTPRVSITTNGGFDGQPDLSFADVVVSFNCVTADAYQTYIGLDMAKVINNIRYLASTCEGMEIHSLAWPMNLSPDQRLLELFGDLPVRIRVSHKVDNQGLWQVQQERVPCDYLDAIVINPDGAVRLCSHDFDSTVILGTVFDLDAVKSGQSTFRRRLHGAVP